MGNKRMRRIGSAFALSCAIALSGYRAEAQDQPPKAFCLSLLAVAMGTYMDFQQYKARGFFDPKTPAELNNAWMYGAGSALDGLISRSRCSEAIWGSIKACIATKVQTADIRAEEGREMVAGACYDQVLEPYNR